jgi:membrane protein
VERWWKVLAAAAKRWNADNAFQHAAAVSFYTLFSLAPVAIIALGIASFFLGPAAAARQFSAQLIGLVGANGALVIQSALTASQASHGSGLSTATGVVLLLVGATSVFAQLQDSLNQIWGVRAHPKRSGLMVLLLQRLISFGMVVTIGFLLLVSLVITTVVEAMTHSANGRLTIPPLVLQGLDLLVALAVATALFAALFKILPDVRLPWSASWGSAFLTGALFSIGKVLIATYLAHSAVASVYGTAGTLVALLVWVYYSCAILFFGVEVMHADLAERGRPILPKKTAVLVRHEIAR